MRAVWTGILSFGLLNIPVEIYSASIYQPLSFKLFDKKDFCPISYKKICKRNGEIVNKKDIVKGYEYEKGNFVMLEDKDFEKANIEKNQKIEIVHFITPWNSRIMNFRKPDFMIFNLGPAEKNWKDLVHITQKLQEILEKGCMSNYCKTSGKRVIHVLITLEAKYTQDQIQILFELIMNIVYQFLTDTTSLERIPSKSNMKIYLDYLQNARGRTLVDPYSLRPWPGATVSTPLKWRKVNAKLNTADFNIKTLFKRIKKIGDTWKPILKKGIDFEKSINCLKKECSFLKTQKY